MTLNQLAVPALPQHSNGRFGMPVLRYPGWRYHASKEALLVNSKAEDDALGDGWEHEPFPVKVNPDDTRALRIAALRAELASLEPVIIPGEPTPEDLAVAEAFRQHELAKAKPVEVAEVKAEAEPISVPSIVLDIPAAPARIAPGRPPAKA